MPRLLLYEILIRRSVRFANSPILSRIGKHLRESMLEIRERRCYIAANRHVIVELFPPGHRRALRFPNRQFIVEVGGGSGAISPGSVPSWLPVVSKTSPAGNRQRPLRGGHRERRTCGAPTRHPSPPRGPPRPVHLLGAGPLRGVVPQVVGPLPAGRPRGPLRPDPCAPPRRPTHPA